MKIFVLVKWEYSIIEGNVCNTWEDAQFFTSMKEAHEAMVSSIADKLNLLYVDVDDTHLVGDSSVEVSQFGAYVRAHVLDIDGTEEFVYKFRIFEKEV